ncbi:MAG: hypothetical protein MR945_04600 [Agathobacter sp.]|nr:hypothetical protein [Agathobacter sp.]
MVDQSKSYTTNDSQSKYGDKKPYNNITPSADEELAPILVTKELAKDKSIIKDNMETWHIHGHNIPVAFAPIKIGTLDSWMKFFWKQVRIYIATGGTNDFLNENGHENDLSYDKFLDDSESDEDKSGFDPGQTPSAEDNVLLGMIIETLITDVSTINPKYGIILEMLCQNYQKGDILRKLELGKSQGYVDIKTAQKLAYDLYHKY